MKPYKIYPISDAALTVDFGNEISEELNDYVLALSTALDAAAFDGFIESIPAYASLSVFYRVSPQTNYKSVSQFLEKLIQNSTFDAQTNVKGKLVEIPVIYEGEDLAYVATYHGLSTEQVIELHTSLVYRVYMMGFLPGFAYLGGMDERLATPRRSTPRLKVPAGSVGIAGKQTGIYPLASPGGWQLIGRTSVKLFDPTNSASLTLLKAGDSVRFRMSEC